MEDFGRKVIILCVKVITVNFEQDVGELTSSPYSKCVASSSLFLAFRLLVIGLYSENYGHLVWDEAICEHFIESLDCASRIYKDCFGKTST